MRTEYKTPRRFKYIGPSQVSFEHGTIYDAVMHIEERSWNEYGIIDEAGDEYVYAWSEKFVLENFVEIAEDGTEKAIAPLDQVMAKTSKVS